MAGALEISDTACWMPAGWVYDNILEAVAAELQKSNSEFASQLRSFQTDKGGYGDLRSSSEKEIRSFARAAKLVLAAKRASGSEAFFKPDFFPGFVTQFEELIAMLEADIRNKNE